MKITRQLIVLCLSYVLVAYAQGNYFNKVRYTGGTLSANVKPKDWGNRLTVSSDAITLALKDGQVVKIDPSLVTGLSYGQEAHRRVGTMVALGVLFLPLALFGLFHKTRLHFIGVQYKTSDNKKEGVLLQGDKKNYRAMILALQGASGVPVSVAENERKFLAVGTNVAIEAKQEPAKEGL